MDYIEAKSESSLKKNVVLNVIKAVTSLLFPLITYRYASRILLPIGMGKYNYVVSIIGYFQLFAGLGVSIYSITEGAKIRGDRLKLSVFSTEVLLINICSMIISYLILFLMIFIGAFRGYEKLIIIYGLTILFNTVGVSWIYNISEDFLFITIRTIIFQIFSLILLFVLVNDENDLLVYTGLTVVATAGANICNVFCLKKHIDLLPKNVNKYDLRRHIKPIFTLFIASAASTIYLHSDKIMLELFHGDYTVGIYSSAVKLITVVSTFIVAYRDALLPRLSFYIANDRFDQAKKLTLKSLSGIYMIVIPAMIGLILLSKEMIVFVSSIDYIDGTISLKILSLELLFSPISAFIAYEVLVPLKKTIIVTIATSVAAVENIVFNFLLIPYFFERGAAIATLISEVTVFIILYYHIRGIVDMSLIRKQLFQYIIASFIMTMVLFIILLSKLPWNITVIVSLVIGGGVYFMTLLLLKNPIIIDLFQKIHIQKRKG